jgi:hypothetical protein
VELETSRSFKAAVLSALLGALSVPFTWFGVLTVRGAATCARGEDCFGPFAEYFVAGIPSLALGYGLIVFGLALRTSQGKRTEFVVTMVAIGIAAIVVTTGILWTK